MMVKEHKLHCYIGYLWTFHILSSRFTIPNSCYKMETQHLLTNANQNSINKPTNGRKTSYMEVWDTSCTPPKNATDWGGAGPIPAKVVIELNLFF